MVDVTKRSPLAQLVDEVCEANGWSRREVVRRAQKAGGTISNSRLGQLLRDYPLTGIQADKIDDLALGLGISRDRVAVAVIQAMGFRVSDHAVTPAEAIRADPSLSSDTKDALLAILRTSQGRVSTMKRGGEHGQRSAPIAEPAEPQPADRELARPTASQELERQLRANLERATTPGERNRIQAVLDSLDAGTADDPDESVAGKHSASDSA